MNVGFNSSKTESHYTICLSIALLVWFPESLHRFRNFLRQRHADFSVSTLLMNLPLWGTLPGKQGLLATAPWPVGRPPLREAVAPTCDRALWKPTRSCKDLSKPQHHLCRFVSGSDAGGAMWKSLPIGQSVPSVKLQMLSTKKRPELIPQPSLDSLKVCFNLFQCIIRQLVQNSCSGHFPLRISPPGFSKVGAGQPAVGPATKEWR